MFARTILSTAVTALVVTTAAAAQSPMAQPAKSRVTLGGSLIGAATVAEFHEQVDRAFGAAFNASYAIDAGRRVALRVDAEWLNHGIESRDVRLATPFGGLRDVELQSSNDIFFVEIGPEVRFPIGQVESYVGASAGLGYFVTTAHASRNDSNSSYTTTVDQHDAVFAYGGRAGVRIPVAGLRNIALDIGAEYQHSDQALFVQKSGITVTEDGTLSFAPVQGKASLWAFNVGVSVPLGR